MLKNLFMLIIGLCSLVSCSSFMHDRKPASEVSALGATLSDGQGNSIVFNRQSSITRTHEVYGSSVVSRQLNMESIQNKEKINNACNAVAKDLYEANVRQINYKTGQISRDTVIFTPFALAGWAVIRPLYAVIHSRKGCSEQQLALLSELTNSEKSGTVLQADSEDFRILTAILYNANLQQQRSE